MIVDGKRHKDYKDLMDIVFSPDGTTWAYNAQTELGWQAVVNGEEREPNDGRGRADIREDRQPVHLRSRPEHDKVLLQRQGISAASQRLGSRNQPGRHALRGTTQASTR